MIKIKNLENEILSTSLRNKEVLFLAESVDVIEDQTNIADVFCEASEEVDDFDVNDFLLDDKSYSNIDFFFHLIFYYVLYVLMFLVAHRFKRVEYVFLQASAIEKSKQIFEIRHVQIDELQGIHSKVGKVILLW